MIPRTRPLAVAVGLALAVSTFFIPQAGAHAPGSQGAAGLGDAYYPTDGNGGIDVVHYDIRNRYDFQSGRLSGRTTLAIRATAHLSSFNLDFLLPVTSVAVNGTPAKFKQYGDHELRITPKAPVAAGSPLRVAVRYSGKPERASSHGEFNWLADRHEVVAMNEPHMATWWFPANDHPTDKATFDIRITVPKEMKAIANGVLVGRKQRRGWATTHWRATEPMATYLAFFAAGSFATRSSTCNGVPNYVAVARSVGRDAHRRAATTLIDRTCSVMLALERVLGRYPFSAVGGVVTSLPASFALENQTRPIYPDRPGATVGLVAHELAHQWFGNSVSISAWRDIWLNEGFAQFFQHYYVNEVLGLRPMRSWFDQTYASLPAGSPFWRVAVGDPGPDLLFDTPVYTRGALTLQALRQRLGEDTFWLVLRSWLAQRAYGNGSVTDFRALAGSISGQDLTGFFDAWLYQPVKPQPTQENGF